MKARRESQRGDSQPDFVVSTIDQLQKSGVLFVGEVSPPSEIKDVYKNCDDLIRIGIFMKDCLDSDIDKMTILSFQCISKEKYVSFSFSNTQFTYAHLLRC